jgi:hypothetical protein
VACRISSGRASARDWQLPNGRSALGFGGNVLTLGAVIAQTMDIGTLALRSEEPEQSLHFNSAFPSPLIGRKVGYFLTFRHLLLEALSDRFLRLICRRVEEIDVVCACLDRQGNRKPCTSSFGTIHRNRAAMQIDHDLHEI